MLCVGDERGERRCLHAEGDLSSVRGAREGPWCLLAAILDAGSGTESVTSEKEACARIRIACPSLVRLKGRIGQGSHSLKERCVPEECPLPFSPHRHGYLSFIQFNELNQFTEGRLKGRAGLREARHTSKSNQGMEEESGERIHPLAMPASGQSSSCHVGKC